ncbi:hypothetical protein Tco_0924206, partial [Tanacetum coccineum]
TVGIDEAYEMSCKDLMKLMIEVYCPRNEIQKLENKMVPKEEDKIERLNVARAYMIGTNKKKAYVGTLPYCNKCKLHHSGPCTVKCLSHKKVGHMARDYKNQADTTNQRALVFN